MSFKAPPRNTLQEPKFSESAAKEFILGAQVAPVRSVPAVTEAKPVVVLRDAHVKSDVVVEKQDEQLVLRFSTRERQALNLAFEASGEKFLQVYVRSLVLPHLQRFLPGGAGIAGASPAEVIVVRDARYKGGAVAERLVEEFGVRFTKTERAALDLAFKQSGYRYLRQYVRSLILPGLDAYLMNPANGV